LTGHINPDGSQNAAPSSGGYRCVADDSMTTLFLVNSRNGQQETSRANKRN
jgi:hypothetical protein